MTPLEKKYSITKERPLSWSAISSFEYDPEQWYRKYVLGEKQPTTPQMEFGKTVGERIAADLEFLPALQRRSVFEYELKGVSFKKIPLIGFIDSYEPHTHLEEYKTGVKPWDQKRADTHGQIDMYLLMLYLQHGVRPEEVSCRVHWMPTGYGSDFTLGFTRPEDPIIRPFETKRDMKQVLEFGNRIIKTYEAMQQYAENHQ